MGQRRIAVLFHAGDRFLPTQRYIIHYLAEYWREDGHDVFFLFGVDRFEPADLLVLHINLSVVPPRYMEFAQRYPATVNGGVRDIRKRTISRNLLGPEDAWPGPVIVKSDLNYSGLPEQKLTRTWLERRSKTVFGLRRRLDRWLGWGSPFLKAADYEVFDHLSLVPAKRFASRHVVVEKFLPEFENGLFFTRIYQFLGDSWSCTRLGSPDCIIKANNSTVVESVEPHQEVLAWRRELAMDYGKLDYVIHEGRAVLLDANKTIGASQYTDSRQMDHERIRAGRRRLSRGIEDFL